MSLPCADCPILKREKAKGSEICCMSSRQCCFTCFDEGCPIKEVYANEINLFHFRMRTSRKFTTNFLRDMINRFGME